MKFIKSLLCAIPLALAITANASGIWVTKELNNLFSAEPHILLLGITADSASFRGLRFECRGAENLKLIYIEESKAIAGMLGSMELPVEKLVIQVDKFDKHESGGDLYKFSKEAVGVLFIDTDQILELITEIGVANKNVLVGVALGVIDPYTVTLDVIDSTISVKEFKVACGLDL